MGGGGIRRGLWGGGGRGRGGGGGGGGGVLMGGCWGSGGGGGEGWGGAGGRDAGPALGLHQPAGRRPKPSCRVCSCPQAGARTGCARNPAMRPCGRAAVRPCAARRPAVVRQSVSVS